MSNPNIENNKENADNLSVTEYSCSSKILDDYSPKRQEIRSTLTSRKISIHFDCDTSEATGRENDNDDSQRICGDTDCSSVSKHNKEPIEEQFKISVKFREDEIVLKSDNNLKNETIVTSNVNGNGVIS